MHFALVNNQNIVERVIVAEQDFIDSLPKNQKWIQTSYNTRNGVHLKGGKPLRKNYAGKGFIYDPEKDEFNPPVERSTGPYPVQAWSKNKANS
jgi:hypothetical protein